MANKTPTIQAKLNENGVIDFSGSECESFSYIIANQTTQSLWAAVDENYNNKQIQAAITSLRGIKPKDEIEGMLATQMVGLHNAAMECMRRAMYKDQTFDGRSYNLSQANKLTRSYAMLVDTLQKYRGKGQQKMTVEHVHINAGGQAIIGNVNNGGGSKNTKTEEQPHAAAVNND